jgi:hypothetical protein
MFTDLDDDFYSDFEYLILEAKHRELIIKLEELYDNLEDGNLKNMLKEIIRKYTWRELDGRKR